LIENYPCNNKDELFARERHWTNEIQCINKIKGKGIIAELGNIEFDKQRHNVYYKNSLDKIKEMQKAYYDANKKKFKEYYDANKKTHKKMHWVRIKIQKISEQVILHLTQNKDIFQH